MCFCVGNVRSSSTLCRRSWLTSVNSVSPTRRHWPPSLWPPTTPTPPSRPSAPDRSCPLTDRYSTPAGKHHEMPYYWYLYCFYVYNPQGVDVHHRATVAAHTHAGPGERVGQRWGSDVGHISVQLSGSADGSHAGIRTGKLWIILQRIVQPKLKICWKYPHPQAIQDVDEFYSSSDLEKCSIPSLVHQWILCSEWVPSEWESKQLIKTSQ